MKRIELEPSKKIGSLTVLSEVTGGKRRQFSCECECGNIVTVRLDHLRSGHTESCGNCGVEYNGERKTVSEWAAVIGINDGTLRGRLDRMSLGEAIRMGKVQV